MPAGAAVLVASLAMRLYNRLAAALAGLARPRRRLPACLWPLVGHTCPAAPCCRSMLRGKMEHADSMGNKGVIGDGEWLLAGVCRPGLAN